MPLINFTKEQKMIQNEVRRFATTELEPLSADIDQKGEIPGAVLKKLAELGLLSPLIPEKYGGTGLDITSLCIMAEELSKVCASIGLILVANNCLASYPVIKYGSEQQKDFILPRLAKGEVGGYDVGAQVDSMDDLAKITQDGESFEISGKKKLILNGCVASFLIVNAKLSDGRTLFLLDRGNGNFNPGKEYTLGLRSAGIAEVEFNRAKLEQRFCLAEKNMIKIILDDLNTFFGLGLSAMAVGIAEAALDVSVKYSKERKQFGRAICEFPMVQEMLAEIKVKVEATRNLVYDAALRADADENYKLAAEIALASSTECATYAGIKSVQVHGGYGYIKDYPVERYLRDAKTLQNMRDSISIKEGIARMLLS